LGSGVNAPPRGARVGAAPLQGKREKGVEEGKWLLDVSDVSERCAEAVVSQRGSVESGEANDDGGGGPGSGVENAGRERGEG